MVADLFEKISLEIRGLKQVTEDGDVVRTIGVKHCEDRMNAFIQPSINQECSKDENQHEIEELEEPSIAQDVNELNNATVSYIIHGFN